MASPASPVASPGSSGELDREPDLEEIVGFFISAKRSIGSAASYATRTHEIVNEARNLLEQSAVLLPKNTFVRASVVEQVYNLEAAQMCVKEVQSRAQKEFKVYKFTFFRLSIPSILTSAMRLSCKVMASWVSLHVR
jgi:hypothetical protein